MIKDMTLPYAYKSHNIKPIFPQILAENAGFIQKACQAAGISRDAYYNWRRSDPEFAAECDKATHLLHDEVESELLKKIRAGDSQCIIFYCKTKLKYRGYTDNPSIVNINEFGVGSEIKDVTTDVDKALLDRYVEDNLKYVGNNSVAQEGDDKSVLVTSDQCETSADIVEADSNLCAVSV